MSRYYKMGKFGGNSMFPPVIKGLLIANVIVFILEHFLGAYSAGGYALKDIIFHYGALFPLDYDNFYIWQVLTYQFLHGGFSHIFFNMIMLWMFGVELENKWGSRRFLIFYLISGVGAALVQLLISPMLGATGPTLGASGSIYGIFLAFALSFPDRHIMIFPLFIPIKAKYLILILVAMDFLMGFSSTSNVAHFAHIGGAATGWFLLKYGEQTGIYRWIDKLIPPKQKQTGWGEQYNTNSNNQTSTAEKAKVFKTDWFKKAETQPKEQEQAKHTSKFHVNGEEIDQSKIDEILDKISESGYQNLTDREKTILFELSQKMR
ncbi:rhomboid family intramembrane serine protease [Bacteroidota bacterium]